MSDVLGFFLTIEGGEGAGKSTLITHLEREFTQKKMPFYSTREPGGTPLGEHLRSILLSHEFQIGNMAELLLFLSARAEHIEKIILPALSQRKIVLSDRFHDSTVAYQGYARGLGYEFVERLCRLISGGLQPDLTLYLDIDPRIGLLRTKNRGSSSDRIEDETLHFHEKLREGFLALHAHDPDRIFLINAEESPEKIFELAKGKFFERLAAHGKI